ncbi:MAG: class I SAM-dependent methyltransferase [Candidatus Omnitrophota bacterium]
MKAIDKIRCDVCDSEEFFTRYDMDGKYSIIECGRCGLWFSYPILTGEEIGHMYAKYHEDWGVVGKDEEVHRRMRRVTFQRLFKSLSRFTAPQGRLLDVGCATGICMEVGEEFGWDVYGVDISDEAAEVARARFGSRVEALDLMDTKQTVADYYDVIIMTDVLEHLNNVGPAMEKINRMLKPGGIVAIVTVNTGSFFAKIMRKKWLFIHRQHLVYFSKKNLKSFLKKTGFDVLRCGAAFKSVNLYYIGEYLRQKSKDLPQLDGISRIMKGIIGRLPRRIKHCNFMIPTGDIVVIARKG